MKRDPYLPLRKADGSMPQPTWWRSTAHRDGQLEDIELEFGSSDSAPDAPPTGLARRDMLKLAGASIALGAASCVRRPEEEILPYTKQPEEIIPGLPTFYATVHPRSEGAVGLVVEAHEGKPTKIEGNALHPGSLGAADVWAQSEIIKLYDPDRARAPKSGGKDASWADWDTFATTLKGKYAGNGGQGLALLVEDDESPTFQRILDAGLAKLPNVKVYRWDPLAADRAKQGAEMAFGAGARVHHSLTNARVVLSIDSDFLFEGPDHLRLAREFSANRRVLDVNEANAKLNRLYVAEGAFTVTGTNADHRFRVGSTQGAAFLQAVAAELAGKHNVQLGELATPPAQGSLAGLEKQIGAVAADLAKNKNGSVVLVGERQPAAVHALAHAINVALGAAEGGLLTVTSTTGAAGAAAAATARTSNADSIAALVTALNASQVETLVIFEANPVHTAPGSLKFAEALKKATAASVHIGVVPDETGKACTWHVPLAHFLEAWGDARAWDGTASIVQPLILPLHGARAGTVLLAQVLGVDTPASASDPVKAVALDRALVEQTWRSAGGALEAEKAWRKALHDGVIGNSARAAVAGAAPNTAEVAKAWGALAAAAAPALSKDSLEVVVVTGNLLDGRLGNNGWNQELPDPVHKMCWDNALLMAPSLAATLGIQSRVKKNKYQADVVKLTAGDRSITAPVFVLPGMGPFTLAITAGYGKSMGEVCAPEGKPVGVNAAPLLDVAAGNVVSGVKLEKTGTTTDLISTQDHFAVPGNPFDEKTFAEMAALKGEARLLRGVDGRMEPERDENGNVIVVNGKAKAGKSRNRPLMKRASLKMYNEQPNFAHEGDIPANLVEHNSPKQQSPRPVKPLQPVDDIVYEGQQWGMVIDLSTCIGCNACVVACQSENNIAIVGRHQVSIGREMHWIRIDRYFSGDVEDPEAGHQPITCMHCELAPCEPVCPVAATVHDEEGINSMAYNRCIGTRYCANNCPYKVRRFNYLDFTVTGNVYVDEHQSKRMRTLRLQRNPDVTVRYRGVMEKCTYCTQRIEQAKIAAKRAGADRKGLPDGAITPACAQTCPTDAIVFGNINDPNSRVAKLKKSDRNYEMLQELNVRPRTTFLARVKNINEELA